MQSKSSQKQAELIRLRIKENPDLLIDIHTHILPDNIPNWSEKFGIKGFVNLEHDKMRCCARMMIDGKLFREVQDNCWSPERRLQDAPHIDIQVISTVPVMFSYWAPPEQGLEVAQFLNDHIAGIVQQYPERYIGLGTLPLQDPAASVKELHRCKEIGILGIQIGSRINQWDLGDPNLHQVYKACEELDMPIFVHPWDVAGAERMQKYWLTWLVGMPAEAAFAICSMIFGGIFEKFPKLRVAFAHGGGQFVSSIGRIERGFVCRPDLVAVDNDRNPRHYLGKFWVDSLVHDPKMLNYIIDLIGADKVAVGSDYPFPLGEEVSGGILGEAQLSASDKRKLLNQSAVEWLGIE